MSDVVIVGLLSLLGTLAGSFGGSRLVIWRIEQLERKVDKHNNFAERIPIAERDIADIKKDVDRHEVKIERNEEKIEQHEKQLAVIAAKGA